MEPDRDRWVLPTFGMEEPDRESWSYRFGRASNKAMWTAGILRPIRFLLAWPLLALVLVIEIFLVTPLRLIRRLANLF